MCAQCKILGESYFLIPSCNINDLALKDALPTTELVLIMLNYVACVPVLMAVGAFRSVAGTRVRLGLRTSTSIYHFLGLLGNSTTIEGWEKDKVATMVRRGKIREIKFPYVCPSFALCYPSSHLSFHRTLAGERTSSLF